MRPDRFSDDPAQRRVEDDRSASYLNTPWFALSKTIDWMHNTQGGRLGPVARSVLGQPTPTRPQQDPSVVDPRLPQPQVPLQPPEVSRGVPYLPSASAGTSDQTPTQQQTALTHLWTTLSTRPQHLPQALWHLAKATVGWVAWNYADLFVQFEQWDGTMWGLMRHMGLIWRGMVCMLITLGLLEIAPFLELLTQWIRIAFDLLRTALQLTAEAAEEVWTLLRRLYADVAGLFA